MKQYLLTAGPTPVPERVLLAMARPVLYQRAPAFTAISGLEMTLSDLGYRIKPGSGVAAAQATFSESRKT